MTPSERIEKFFWEIEGLPREFLTSEQERLVREKLVKALRVAIDGTPSSDILHVNIAEALELR